MLNLRRGFTLVELLVVLAIIGILLALLIPAITAARSATYEITVEERAITPDPQGGAPLCEVRATLQYNGQRVERYMQVENRMLYYQLEPFATYHVEARVTGDYGWIKRMSDPAEVEAYRLKH